MKRNVFIVLAVLGVFMIIIGCSSQLQSGYIARMTGTVLVNGEPAIPGSAVKQNDVIYVDDDGESYIDIKFSTGHYIRFMGGTLKIADISDTFKLDLESGKTFAVVERLAREQSFIVETPTAAAGVRGTKFLIQQKPDEAYICVCDGVVSVNKIGEDITREVGVGQDLHVYQNKSIDEPVESPQMYQMTIDVFIDMGFREE